MTQENKDKNEKELRILAVDCGYGDTKVSYKANGDTKLSKFGTVVTRHVDKGVALDDSTAQSTSCYAWEDGDYCVNAEIFGSPVYAREVSFLTKYSPLLVAHAMAKLGITSADVDMLVVGLPLMNLKAHKDELATRLKHFKVNGLDCDFTNIIVVGQGIGGYYDHLATNNVLTGELGYILDFGYNTVLGVSYSGRKIVSNECFQHDKGGISAIIYNVADTLTKRHKVEVSHVDVKNAFVDKQVISIRGESVNISELLKKETTNYIETTIFKLIDKYGANFNKLKSIYLVGGGAYYLKDKLPADYQKLFIVAPNAEYANVRGYIIRAEQTLQG